MAVKKDRSDSICVLHKREREIKQEGLSKVVVRNRDGNREGPKEQLRLTGCALEG